MNVITIYGEIERWKIFSEGQVYPLEKDSLVYPRASGWFQLEKSGNRWKLHRMLRESRAEVYPDWDNQQVDGWIDFVSVCESISMLKGRRTRTLSQAAFSTKIPFPKNSLSIFEIIYESKTFSKASIKIFIKFLT